MAQRLLQESVGYISVRVQTSFHSKPLTSFGHLDLDLLIRSQAFRFSILTQRHIPAKSCCGHRMGQTGLKLWADLSYRRAVSPKVANGYCLDFQPPFRIFRPLLFRTTTRLRWESILWAFSFWFYRSVRKMSVQKMTKTIRVSVCFERCASH